MATFAMIMIATVNIAVGLTANMRTKPVTAGEWSDLPGFRAAQNAATGMLGGARQAMHTLVLGLAWLASRGLLDALRRRWFPTFWVTGPGADVRPAVQLTLFQANESRPVRKLKAVDLNAVPPRTAFRLLREPRADAQAER